ncbi:MAG: hypothetical protein QXY05_03725 [Candidatus Anstonellales archaeon]
MDWTTLVYDVVVPGLLDGFFAALKILLVFIVAWIVERIFSGVVWKISENLRVEKRIKDAGLENALLGFTLTGIVVLLIKLYIYLLALTIAGDVSGVPALEMWGFSALGYIHSAVQGIILLIATLFVADYIANRINKSKVMFANALAIVVEVFIVYNGVVLSLPALMPSADTSLLKDAFMIVLGAFAIAFAIGAGLALGLGLKDTISTIAKKKQRTIEKLLS